MSRERHERARPRADPDPVVQELPAIHPSFIQVAKPYVFEQTIQDCIQAMGVNPMREESLRLQGVLWIDNVRKVLHLPVRTFNTAVIYYHRFRLAHSDSEFNFTVCQTSSRPWHWS
jgi:CTD kinase subunit beta